VGALWREELSLCQNMTRLSGNSLPNELHVDKVFSIRVFDSSVDCWRVGRIVAGVGLVCTRPLKFLLCI